MEINNALSNANNLCYFFGFFICKNFVTSFGIFRSITYQVFVDIIDLDIGIQDLTHTFKKSSKINFKIFFFSKNFPSILPSPIPYNTTKIKINLS